MNVLHLLSLGFNRQQSARIVGCHPNFVTKYIKLYDQGGLDAIRQLNYSFPRHDLHAIYDEVDQVLNAVDCYTVRDMSATLLEHFDYDRSDEAVRQLLHRLGYKRRKTGAFPGKIDKFEEWKNKQEAFIEKLYQLIQQAENEDIDLIFGDAAHFVYGKFNKYCWGKEVKYSPSGHGRYRINVDGVYDVATNQVYAMYNEGYINAEFMVTQ